MITIVLFDLVFWNCGKCEEPISKNKYVLLEYIYSLSTNIYITLNFKKLQLKSIEYFYFHYFLQKYFYWPLCVTDHVRKVKKVWFLKILILPQR